MILDVVAAGKHQSVTVDADGEPFRTTGTGSAPPVRWDGSRWSAPAPPTTTPTAAPTGPGPACQALPDAEAEKAVGFPLTAGRGCPDQSRQGVTERPMAVIDTWSKKDDPLTVFSV